MIQAILPGSVTPQQPPGSAKSVVPTTTTSSSPMSWHRAITRLWFSPARHRDPRRRSINGTFVNGARVDSAVLNEGDVITIGNVDLVFTDGTLIRRTETGRPVPAAWRCTGSPGIDGNETLLDNISLSARPGTLTAIIGPSGAGKSTLARLIAGYTHPTTGTVTFEGHNIHAEYASLRSRIGMVPQDDVVHRQLTVNQALATLPSCGCPPTPARRAPRSSRRCSRNSRLTTHARHPRGQALRRPAQTRFGGAGAADRSVAAASSTSPPRAWTRRWTVKS